MLSYGFIYFVADKLSLDDPIPIEMLEFENVIDKKGSISNMTVKT